MTEAPSRDIDGEVKGKCLDADKALFADPASQAAAIELIRLLKDLNYRFTTVSPLTHSYVNRRSENALAQNLCGVFGWSRPFEASVVGPIIMNLLSQANLLESKQNYWQSKVRITSLANDLFMHSAYPTRANNAVFFGPDTNRFVAAIDRHLNLRKLPVVRAADIGCGAGAGAFAIARHCAGAQIFALDINSAALQMTWVNAKAANVDLVVRQSDVLDAVPGEFDLIVSNPPFLIDPAGRAYRHGGGELGAALSLNIAQAASHRLKPGGVLLLYTGVAVVDSKDPLFAALQKILEASGVEWSYVELDPDIFAEELLTQPYRSADRIAAVLLTVTRS